MKQLKIQLKEEKTVHDENMAAKKKVLSVLKDQLKDVKTQCDSCPVSFHSSSVPVSLLTNYFCFSPSGSGSKSHLDTS